MRSALLFLCGIAIATAALADDATTYSCKRYQSQCKAGDCRKLAAQMVVRPESVQKILAAATQLETLNYAVMLSEAKETATNAAEAPAPDPLAAPTTPPAHASKSHVYEYVSKSDGGFMLENRTTAGQTKEEVNIAANGFYSYYLISTDGSMHDVPIGEPYVTYFGACTKTSADAAPAAPVAVAPKAPELPQ